MRKYIALTIAGAGSLFTLPALAQFSAPVANNAGALLGDPTVGSETGIYEFSGLVVGGLTAAVALVLFMVGYQLVTKVIRKNRG